jgi:hypothetical protein
VNLAIDNACEPIRLIREEANMPFEKRLVDQVARLVFDIRAGNQAVATAAQLETEIARRAPHLRGAVDSDEEWSDLVREAGKIAMSGGDAPAAGLMPTPAAPERRSAQIEKQMSGKGGRMSLQELQEMEAEVRRILDAQPGARAQVHEREIHSVALGLARPLTNEQLAANVFSTTLTPEQHARVMKEFGPRVSAEFGMTDVREKIANRLDPLPRGGWGPPALNPTPKGMPAVRAGSVAPSVTITPPSPPRPRMDEPIRHEPELVVAQRMEAEQGMRQELSELFSIVRKLDSAEARAFARDVASYERDSGPWSARGGLHGLVERGRALAGRPGGQFGQGHEPGSQQGWSTAERRAGVHVQ